jgi:hypothetical protein
MPEIFQIENIKLVVLFVLIAAIITMSHYGSPTNQRVRRPLSRTLSPRRAA